MTTIRKFCCNDLPRIATLNLDHLTETFDTSFYMTHMNEYPDFFHVAESPGNQIMGYIMGKVEGEGESRHGHVTVLTVAPEYRRQKVATKLLNLFEEICDNNFYKAHYVDLFVTKSNEPAIKMFEKLGYVIYRRRRVTRYYPLEDEIYSEDPLEESWEEDGLDMRKALSRDVQKKSMIPLTESYAS